MTTSIPDPGSVAGGTVSSMPPSGWDETTINFANRPTAGRNVLAIVGALSASQLVEVDVTPAIATAEGMVESEQFVRRA